MYAEISAAGVALVATLTLGSAANAALCGISGQSPAQIQSNVRMSGGFKRGAATALYISYLNEKAPMTLTFTTAANNAHPAVACRRAVQKGGAWHIVTNIRCGASKRACDALAREFNALDAAMKRQLEKSKPKP